LTNPRDEALTSSRSESIARAIKTYNAAADTFDAAPLSFWSRYGQRTIDHLNLRPGDDVLDVCCGTGASAIPAAITVGPTGSVLGVDVSDGLLRLAREKAQHLDNITFQNHDCMALDLPDGSFDAIVCVFGIFFLPDMTAALRELWRMVKPGGNLVITSWGKACFDPANQVMWDAVKMERPDLYRAYTPWDRISESAGLQTLLESAGATAVKVWAESDQHRIQTPEDWWTIVMGGGWRGTIEQIDAPTVDRIRQVNLDYLVTSGVRSLDVDVLYAIAQKPRSAT
jgi:ubiquinone/menaquinone biosynthesis C-methylase UbiE